MIVMMSKATIYQTHGLISMELAVNSFLFTDNLSIHGLGGISHPAIEPIDVCSKLLTDDVYDLVVNQTNLNAQQVIMS